MPQSYSTVLMVRPMLLDSSDFLHTAVLSDKSIDVEGISKRIESVQQEIDTVINLFKSIGVEVIVFDDVEPSALPCCVFINDLISFHSSGEVILYPIFVPERRKGRKEELLDLLEVNGFFISDVMDYSTAEGEGVFLDGGSSVLLDRECGVAYCSLSEHSNEDLFIELCEDFHFLPIIFDSFCEFNGKQMQVLHTSRMMFIGHKYALICIESILDKNERKFVLNSLKQSNREIIFLTSMQRNVCFGNMIEVKGQDGMKNLVMTSKAFQNLTNSQTNQIEKYVRIFHLSLDTIESLGTGSFNAMISEVFLPRN